MHMKILIIQLQTLKDSIFTSLTDFNSIYLSVALWQHSQLYSFVDNKTFYYNLQLYLLHNSARLRYSNTAVKFTCLFHRCKIILITEQLPAICVNSGLEGKPDMLVMRCNLAMYVFCSNHTGMSKKPSEVNNLLCCASLLVVVAISLLHVLQQ